MADQEYTYDVLIVGGGSAGCCAAFAALEKKVRVGVLEKASVHERGGNSALTGQMRFVYNGMEDLRPLVRNATDAELRPLVERLPHRSEAEIWDDFIKVTDGQCDQELLQVHVSESLKTVQWLASKGHDWTPQASGLAYIDNILIMNGGGYGLQQRNFSMLERAGVKFHYETSASELIVDEKARVAGVVAVTPSGYVRFNAKAVILTCGGFEANAEMRARYLGPGWDMVRVRGVPFNTGDGLLMAMDVGAMPYGSWTTCHASPQDVNLPPFTVPVINIMEGSYDRSMYPYSILVNTNGERFVDEAEDVRGRTYAKMGKAVLAQPGGVAFQIFDAKVRRMGLYPSNYAQATNAKADTLEALAAELEVNAANLVETVRTFNAAIQPGEFKPNRDRLDGKCTAGIHPKKSNYAVSVEEPPFEGYAVRCGITFTYGGLKIDPTSAQVQHKAGRPLPGLYCAGEMMGGLFVGNYAAGSGMMSGATFGRIAGAHAAEEAASK